MDWFVPAFLKSSLTWLGLGVTLGVAMAIDPALVVYRPAHLHMNLLGFMTMMVFGVGYQMLPRMSGHQLLYPRLAGVHVWLANTGLALLTAGFVLAPHGLTQASTIAKAAGGSLAALGAYAFIFNIWRSMNAGAALRARLRDQRTRAGDQPVPRGGLPVMQEH